jgi:hypothetical protein
MGLREILQGWLLPAEVWHQVKEVTQQRNYRTGKQKRQLKIVPFQPDDNIVMNFTGLVIDRSVSMLFGKGIDTQFDTETAQEYIDMVLEANREELLLHNMALTGSEAGTFYVKIVPEGLTYKGVVYPRLIVLDPMLITIDTEPNDKEKVTAYRIVYIVKENGKEVIRQELTRLDGEKWVVESGIIENDKFAIEKTTDWLYPFPPIIHGQNLPNIESVYGDPDVTQDVVELQDRLNLTSSNISKILRLHAHPILIGKGMAGGSNNSVDIEPGKLLKTTAEQDVYSVEMQSDLASSQQYLTTMRQALFDVTRTVDISSMSDKLGALTNFGLKVLYQDAIAKNNTKQALYGEVLEELFRRLLILNNMPEEHGEIIWPDVLPVDDVGQMNALKAELELGLVSKETAATERRRNFEQEQEKIGNEKSQGDNIGEMLLQNFNRGG